MLPKTLVTAAPDGAQDAGINAAKVGRRLARSRPPLALCPCLSEGTITEHCCADTALVFIH